jgi:GNAT superfamily N-acetyltransferase
METRGDYTLDFSRSAQQAERIHAYLVRSYWSQGIPLSLVERSIANSLCVGVFHRGDQVGFARVVSDLTIFAYLCDVYVLEEHRGRGLASWMLGAIAAHPDLQGLRRFILATRDAHKLYEKHGFTPVRRPESLMEILKRPAYARPAG